MLQGLLQKRILCLNTTTPIHRDDDAGRIDSPRQKYTKDPRTNLPIIPVPGHLKDKFPMKLDGGVIHYMGTVDKISTKGKELDRILVITNNLVFLCRGNDGNIARCIPIQEVSELLVDEQSGTVAFKVPNEFDLFVKPLKWVHIVNVMEPTYEFLMGKKLEVRKTKMPPEDAGKLNNILLKLEKPQGFSLTVQPISIMEEIADWEKTQEELSKRDAEITNLSGDLDRANQEATTLRQSKAQLEQMVRQLQGQLDTLGGQLEDVQGKYAKMMENSGDRMQLLAMELQETQADAARVQQAFEEAAAEVTELRGERATLQVEYSQLKATNADLQTATEQMRKELDGAKVRELELGEALSTAQIQHQRLQQEKQQMQEAHEAVETARQEAMLQKENAHRAKVERLEENLRTLDEDLTRWKEASQKWVTLNADLLKKNAAMMTENDSLRRTLIQVEHDLKVTEQTLGEQLASSKATVAEQQAALAERDKVIAQWEVTNKECLEEMVNLQDELRDAQEFREEALRGRERVKHLEIEVNELRESLLQQVCVICKQQKVVAQVGGGYLRYNDFVRKFGKTEAQRVQAAVVKERIRRIEAGEPADESPHSHAASPSTIYGASPRSRSPYGSPRAPPSPETSAVNLREGKIVPTVIRKQGNRLAVQI